MLGNTASKPHPIYNSSHRESIAKNIITNPNYMYVSEGYSHVRELARPHYYLTTHKPSPRYSRGSLTILVPGDLVSGWVLDPRCRVWEFGG